MKKKIFILTSEDYKKPSDARELQKDNDGVTLIQRLLNQIAKQDAGTPTVVSKNTELMLAVNCDVFVPANYGSPITACDMMECAKGEWGKENIILMGDIPYEDDVIELILKKEFDEITVYKAGDFLALYFNYEHARTVGKLLSDGVCKSFNDYCKMISCMEEAGTYFVTGGVDEWWQGL